MECPLVLISTQVNSFQPILMMVSLFIISGHVMAWARFVMNLNKVAYLAYHVFETGGKS